MPIDYAKLKMDIDEVSARLHNVRGDIVESDVGNVIKNMMTENWISIHEAIAALLLCKPLDLANRLGAVIKKDLPKTRIARRAGAQQVIDGRKVMDYIKDRSN